VREDGAVEKPAVAGWKPWRLMPTTREAMPELGLGGTAIVESSGRRYGGNTWHQERHRILLPGLEPTAHYLACTVSPFPPPFSLALEGRRNGLESRRMDVRQARGH